LNQYGFFENALQLVTIHKPTSTIPNDIYNIESKFFMVLGGTWGLDFSEAGFILGAVVFGACHCIAWNFDFPTPIEQTLWRATSVFTAAAMPAYYLSWYALAQLELEQYMRLLRMLTCITYMLYTVCRLYMMVEVFRSLFYLPPDAFAATWSSAVPHAD